MLAHYTDVLITINREDYYLAKKKMKAKKVKYIPGVGVDRSRFSSISEERKSQLRNELGIPSDAVVILSVGELNQNKNHQIVIRALAKLARKDVYYVICGRGELHDRLQMLANQCGIGEYLKLAGYRDDISVFYGMADIFVLSSLREGIPAVVMEAMSSRIPVVASRIRGVVDMLSGSKLLFDPKNDTELTKCLAAVIDDPVLKQSEVDRNIISLTPFLLENVVKQYERIYRDFLANT